MRPISIESAFSIEDTVHVNDGHSVLRNLSILFSPSYHVFLMNERKSGFPFQAFMIYLYKYEE